MATDATDKLLVASVLERGKRDEDTVQPEQEDEIGGCLVHKIPEWRLPRRVVHRDLSIIEALEIDVEVETGGAYWFLVVRRPGSPGADAATSE